MLERAARHPSFVVGSVLVALLLLAAALSLLWQPWPPAEIDIPHKLAAPSAAHWLGTDSLGRDIASQLLVGSQNSIVVGVIAVGIGLTLGVALGCLAAARRGWVEELVMRASDLTFAFPALLSAIMLTRDLRPGPGHQHRRHRHLQHPGLRAPDPRRARSVWTRDYVLAARAAGKGGWRITSDHVLPNIANVLIVQATIQFALAILAEAALSYLGLGTQPPQPSWGRMLNEAQTMLFEAPLLAVYPGVAIALAVLGLNLMGDGLRDLLDPRLSRQR